MLEMFTFTYSPEDLDFYLSLRERLSEAVMVRQAAHRFQNGSLPAPQACQTNSRRVALENPGWTAIPGWLFRQRGGAMIVYAHTINRDPHGQCFDVTPYAAGPDPIIGFLPHLGTFEDFVRRANGTAWGYVYPK